MNQLTPNVSHGVRHSDHEEQEPHDISIWRVFWLQLIS